ncbi:hypothetical protein Desku_0884 [Desulfofundulus kuznetsovii DSM 6115]|uniref:DNA methylase adenine-specific domain-containing protein n=1 Tax=Desulfofundulus kuznetsovii (strain DSM 6115 / VKM B-1805 / 17) TaxID=760568 RepID=A0AAU8PX99_DESK7|nr:hypothetical protein Desku_0884 [Desulfofundulus kuznetsovii DSM 6115]
MVLVEKMVSGFRSDFNRLSLLSCFPKEVTLEEANAKIEKMTNLSCFFETVSELNAFISSLYSGAELTLYREKNGRQWGDYQTPISFATEICKYLVDYGCRPKVVIEPTSGEGNFIRAAADSFPEAKHIYGVEIQPVYVSLSKLNLLFHALSNGPFGPKISVCRDNIFTHQFPAWITDTKDEILVLGNPPWVTNAELSTLDSDNVPMKENFKGFNGLDALTGKSNFDISEYIIWRLLELFHEHKGYLALLCKNVVIRNIVQELPKRCFKVGDIKAFKIDAKKLFNANVEASLMLLRFGVSDTEAKCSVYSWEDTKDQVINVFGWVGNKFVSNVDSYQRWQNMDGNCPYIWRQGLKHDCSKVMELIKCGGIYKNAIGEQVDVEHEVVYPLLKSSDLKGFAVTTSRLWVPVVQRKIGEDTSYIEMQYPKLWAYLIKHQSYFDARKSSIYKGKPRFSIFGIGEYSFAPYKVAISGMYKTANFVLIMPIDGKPVMLDDTCYFLGFESYKDSLFVCSALNSEPVQDFIKALVFLDSKRPYKKELLMRIDLREVFKYLTFETLTDVWVKHSYKPSVDCTREDYANFLDRLFASEMTNYL